MCVQQRDAVEGGKDGLKIECCCRVIEGGTVLLSSIVRSAAYVVYKRRQRGLREPLGSSKHSSRGKRLGEAAEDDEDRMFKAQEGRHTWVFRRLRRKGKDLGTLDEGRL